MVLDQATASIVAPNDLANETAAAERFLKVEVNIISALDLPRVRDYLDIKPYAKVRIGGVGETKQKTAVDEVGGRNPHWNHKIVYAAKEATICNENTVLNIELCCARSFKFDKYIGEVNLSLKELFDSRISSAEPFTRKVYNCQKGNKIAAGTLEMSCAFGILTDDEQESAGNALAGARPGKLLYKEAVGNILLAVVKGVVGMIVLDVVPD